MSAVAIEASGLSKKYRIGSASPAYGRLSESISGVFRSALRPRHAHPESPTEHWALKDVSFEVPAGEVVGIIGRNGAGKTTLLKILARITEPTAGHARLAGRVGSLLEVGTGFHPELSGRENVILNGAILGMKRSEIQRKFDEIVEFAEMGKFIDTPVKRYSSGMQVRLAFSVAAHLEPEILIIDEVLAVGDLAFQKKCIGRMGEVSRLGRTVLFVSHNMAAVESLCSTAYLLDGGQLVSTGPVADVVREYVDMVSASRTIVLADRGDRRGDGRLRFTQFDAALVCGKPGRITLSYRATSGLRNVHVSIGLATPRGEGAMYVSNDLMGHDFGSLPESGELVCDFDKVALLPGTYSASIYCTTGGVLCDWIVDAATIEVEQGDYFGTGKLPPNGYGSAILSHRWSESKST